MAELPVEMPNLLKFPMEKLCYDLVLEVIDALEPKDVPELMKVDRRFRCILLQKPARIFGKQIHLISVEMDDRESLDDGRKRYQDLVFIMKFPESRPLPFYFLSLKVLLLSQVERCSVLDISDVWCNVLDEKGLSPLKKAFADLKQVDELQVKLYGDNFNDFLWNLKAKVTDLATLRFSDSHLELMLSLINGSLQNCKMISVDPYDGPDVYPTLFSALSKTQLELFVTEVRGGVKSIIEWTLNSGIPSENEGAACIVQGKMAVVVNDLIKNFPEIRQVNEPDIRTFIRDTMMETLRKHRVMDRGCYRSRSNFPRSVSVSAASLSISEDPCSDSDDSHSDSDDSHSDSDDSHADPEDSDDSDSDSDSDSDDSRSASDDSLSLSAESDYCDRSRSPPPARSRSVSVSAESLHSMDRNPMKRGVEHYESLSVSAESLSVSDDSRSDSDDSLHSMGRSPIKREVVHYVYLDGPFDCYWKRIDEKRDCIYVVCHGFFFAKYVSSIQF